MISLLPKYEIFYAAKFAKLTRAETRSDSTTIAATRTDADTCTFISTSTAGGRITADAKSGVGGNINRLCVAESDHEGDQGEETDKHSGVTVEYNKIGQLRWL